MPKHAADYYTKKFSSINKKVCRRKTALQTKVYLYYPVVLTEGLEKKAARLAPLAKIFAHENRLIVLLRVLEAVSPVAAGDAWPASVSGQNRWKHLALFRKFLQIEKIGRGRDSQYSVDERTRERLRAVVDALESLVEEEAPPTLRLSMQRDGLCLIHTPDRTVQVERSDLLGALAVILESFPK